MDSLPLKHTKWSDRLAFDIAIMLEGSGETTEEVFARHRICADDMLRYNKDPIFLKKVEGYRTSIREEGMTFRLKARAQAEELLTTSWTMIHNPEVNAAVKADLIKHTIKWSGLEPKNDNIVDGNNGGVRITINLGNELERAGPVVEHEASTTVQSSIEDNR